MVRLKSKYSTAPYVFFGVHNIIEARNEFLQNEVRNPTFVYGPHFDQIKLQERLDTLKADITSTPPGETLEFLQDRKEQTEFLLVANQLHAAPSPAEELVQSFRAANQLLYGPPSPAVAYGILKNLEEIANKYPSRLKHWQYIAEYTQTKKRAAILRRPSADTHAYYKEALLQYAPWLSQKDDDLPQKPTELMRYALEQIGAHELGWSVRRARAGANAHVSYTSKWVTVGGHYKPRSFSTLKQIVAHEVYGHVNRHIVSGGAQFPTEEAEGLAITLEQLVRKKFTHKRTLRYLAVAAGWGVFGEPKDFRDTFEIVWRAAAILSGYKEATAKQRAFNECVRAFRGGHPNVPGAVFTKDIVYVEGNMRVWQWLEEQKLSYEAFVDLLEGRRTVEV